MADAKILDCDRRWAMIYIRLIGGRRQQLNYSLFMCDNFLYFRNEQEGFCYR